MNSNTKIQVSKNIQMDWIVDTDSGWDKLRQLASAKLYFRRMILGMYCSTDTFLFGSNFTCITYYMLHIICNIQYVTYTYVYRMLHNICMFQHFTSRELPFCRSKGFEWGVFIWSKTFFETDSRPLHFIKKAPHRTKIMIQ